MWELGYKDSWALKNWCFWTVVLEKILESPLDCKEIQPVHPEGDQSWVFFGRTDVKAETLILWPPDAESWLIWKDPDAGKDWRQEEKGTTEDEMVGWHHWLIGHEFGWTPGVGDGQRSGALQSMGSQRVGHDWATEPKWTDNGLRHVLLTSMCLIFTNSLCVIQKINFLNIECRIHNIPWWHKCWVCYSEFTCLVFVRLFNMSVSMRLL